MSQFDQQNDVSEALSAPLADMIASIGQGVAEAQQSMDTATIETFKDIYYSKDKAFEHFKQLGYQPTWYQIPEVNAEINLTFSMSGQQQTTAEQKGSAVRLYAAPVDATYSSKYNFDLKGSSKLSFRIVPVPPSATAEEMNIVPDINDTPWSEAKKLLEQEGLPYAFVNREQPADEDVIEESTPAAGEILAGGNKVIIKFK